MTHDELAPWLLLTPPGARVVGITSFAPEALLETDGICGMAEAVDDELGVMPPEPVTPEAERRAFCGAECLDDGVIGADQRGGGQGYLMWPVPVDLARTQFALSPHHATASAVSDDSGIRERIGNTSQARPLTSLGLPLSIAANQPALEHPMAKLPNLDDMTSKELKDLRNQVDIAIVERTKAERADLKAQLEALAAEAGLSLEDVLGGGRGKGSRGTVAIKYRNPDDPTQTWTGRGRKPIWLTEKMAKRGAKIDDYAV